MTEPLDLDFTGQEPLPEAAVRRANELFESGALFRYGEAGAEQMDAALLEEEFAALVDRRFCVAFNSCGASLAAALISAGVERGEPVLMNAFTLAPVPGSIVHAGAEPVFVDITDRFHIDLADLRRQHEATGARWLLLSYMRGHIPDVDEVMAVCDELGITVIEDCAHTMGGAWDGRPTGTFGIAGCFSTQTFKHVNSGEGGLLVTDDEDLAARAVLLSGSYMLYGQHGARPSDEVFERHRLTTPNFSMRMSALAAALVRPQLALLPARAETWNASHRRLADGLDAIDGIDVPDRDERERFVASSIQFRIERLEGAEIAAFVDRAADAGVALKWFGSDQPKGFTSRFDHWRYAPEQSKPHAAAVLANTIDMRIPLAMSPEQADHIVEAIERSLS